MAASFDTSSIRALIFDLMGTCTDWKTAIVSAMAKCNSLCGASSQYDRDVLARQWRAGFFDEIHNRYNKGLPHEDIDVTHRRVFEELLSSLYPHLGQILEAGDKDFLVQSWHDQICKSVFL